jgi:membrane dipeptidase
MSRAQALMRSGVVWDNHACMPLRPHDETFLPQIERCRTAGIDVVSLNVGFGENTPEDHLRMLGQFRSWFARRPELYAMPRLASEIEEAKAAGKLSIVFDIEGMNAVGGQPSLVQAYYDLGVRWMLVAYNNDNLAGGGCVDADPGLTGLGREVIAEMERAGMLVCCSHTGHRTAREVLAYAKRPVIFSHSNPSAVWAHPRNIPDELMLACAASGGVIGLNGIGSFLGANDASIATWLTHLDYAVGVVGPDHVSIALDYCFDRQELIDYVRTMKATFPSEMGLVDDLAMIEPEAMPLIVQGMLDRGHSPETVTKVMGGNLMRLAKACWR